MANLTKQEKQEYKNYIRQYIYRFFSVIQTAKKYEDDLNENGRTLIQGYKLYNENLNAILTTILKNANSRELQNLKLQCDELIKNFQIEKSIDQLLPPDSNATENDTAFINTVCADAEKGFNTYNDVFYKDKEFFVDLKSFSTENNDEIIDVDWTIWKLNEKKEYELFEDYTIVTTKDNKDSIKITQSGNYKIIANIFKSDNEEKILELKERKSVLINVINNSSNLINKTKDGKYEIIYDKDNTNVYYLDKNVITNEITEIKQNDDMYRKLSTALGIEKKITNEKLKEQMLDNGYCFVNNVGWIKQQDYNEHREGKNEKEVLSSSYEYGIFKRLQNAIENHDKKAFEALPKDKFNNYDDWIKLIEDDNTQLSNFKLRAKYITNHLYLYYFNTAKTEVYAEILDIDALSKVKERLYPTANGNDIYEAPNIKKSNTTRTIPNNNYYIPKVFPSGTWEINDIVETTNNYKEFGPYKLKTNAYQEVKIWNFGIQNKTDTKPYWYETQNTDNDKGYLIHGGDGGNDSIDIIDKSKGNNRFSTNTQGCIRISNKDVYLLVNLLTNKLPINLEVK